MPGILRVDQANVDIINAKTVGGKVYIPGHVVQVQSVTKTDTWTASMAAGTWTDITGLSTSITPVYATSKILVFGTIYGNGQSAVTQFYFRIMRDTTPIGIGDAAGNRNRYTGRGYYASDNLTVGMPFSTIDSPSSTSTITYKIQATTEATSNLYVNRTPTDTDNTFLYFGRSSSNITIMEIAQ